jgi:hypothetical protein
MMREFFDTVYALYSDTETGFKGVLDSEGEVEIACTVEKYPLDEPDGFPYMVIDTAPDTVRNGAPGLPSHDQSRVGKFSLMVFVEREISHGLTRQPEICGLH